MKNSDLTIASDCHCKWFIRTFYLTLTLFTFQHIPSGVVTADTLGQNLSCKQEHIAEKEWIKVLQHLRQNQTSKIENCCRIIQDFTKKSMTGSLTKLLSAEKDTSRLLNSPFFSNKKASNVKACRSIFFSK